MKKVIVIALLFVLCVSLCACVDTSNQTLYDDFNQMAKVAYASYTVEVEQITDGETLSSSYKVQTENGISKIEYRYEVLNSVEEVDGAFVVPDEYKSVKQGSVTVKNGEILERSGDALNVDVSKINGLGLNFAQAYFENESVQDNSFTAKVKNVNAFLGKSVDCSNMTVAIAHNGSRFEKVTISYTTNTSSTEIKYSFD